MPAMLNKEQQEQKALAQGAAIGLVFDKHVRSDSYEVIYRPTNAFLAVVPTDLLLGFVDGFCKAAEIFTDLAKNNEALDRVYEGKY